MIFYPEAVVRGCSLKQVFLEISQNPYEFCEILKNTFFTEHLWWLHSVRY